MVLKSRRHPLALDRTRQNSDPALLEINQEIESLAKLLKAAKHRKKMYLKSIEKDKKLSGREKFLRSL